MEWFCCLPISQPYLGILEPKMFQSIRPKYLRNRLYVELDVGQFYFHKCVPWQHCPSLPLTMFANRLHRSILLNQIVGRNPHFHWLCVCHLDDSICLMVDQLSIRHRIRVDFHQNPKNEIWVIEMTHGDKRTLIPVFSAVGPSSIIPSQNARSVPPALVMTALIAACSSEL